MSNYFDFFTSCVLLSDLTSLNILWKTWTTPFKSSQDVICEQPLSWKCEKSWKISFSWAWNWDLFQGIRKVQSILKDRLTLHQLITIKFPLSHNLWPNMSRKLFRLESKSFSRIFFASSFLDRSEKRSGKKCYKIKNETHNISAVCSPFWTCHAGSRSIDWLLIYQFRTSTLGFIALMKTARNGKEKNPTKLPFADNELQLQNSSKDMNGNLT